MFQKTLGLTTGLTMLGVVIYFLHYKPETEPKHLVENDTSFKKLFDF